MSSIAQPEPISSTGILPERIVRKASRADFYFRPDPWVNGLVAKVEEVLERVIESDDSLMSEIARHMVFGHAKRLRPIFVLLGQHLFQDKTLDVAIDTAAAAELVHCATLFHDDVIDSAETRKGRPAANEIWGNKSAVIMGDHFLVLAYSLLTRNRDFRLIELFVELCRALAEGVMMEIRNTGDLDVTLESHFETITRKTAAFFHTAATVGGYLGGASPEQEKHLAAFGLNFGLAFQLSDDLLDLFADPVATGKPRGSDLRSGIYTAAIIHALAECPSFAKRFRPVLEKGDLASDDIDQIAGELKSNGIMEYVQGLVGSHGDKALAHLDMLPEGNINDTFRNLLHRITSRRF